MLILAVCIGLLTLCLLYSIKRGRAGDTTSHSSYSWSNGGCISFALFFAEGFCEALREKKLEKFLTIDYVPPLSLSYEDIADSKTVQKKLCYILDDILRFLKLPGPVRLKIEYESGNDALQGEAGSYHNEDGKRTITVKIKPFYSGDNVMAILCHEAAHYFTEHYRLDIINTTLNEQRTDVAANLIGFNAIMIEGYREIQKVTESWNIRTIERHKIGYIAYSDCLEIRKFLQDYRDNIHCLL